MPVTVSPSGVTRTSTSQLLGKFMLLSTRTLRVMPSVHTTETVCSTSAPFSSTRERLAELTTP